MGRGGVEPPTSRLSGDDLEVCRCTAIAAPERRWDPCERFVHTPLNEMFTHPGFDCWDACCLAKWLPAYRRFATLLENRRARVAYLFRSLIREPSWKRLDRVPSPTTRSHVPSVDGPTFTLQRGSNRGSINAPTPADPRQSDRRQDLDLQYQPIPSFSYWRGIQSDAAR